MWLYSGEILGETMKELTVNWHITEACNLKCQYCFAKWEKPCKRELLHHPCNVLKLLDEISKLPKDLGGGFDSLRLNLVGGETFLYRSKVINIIEEAKKRGMRLSAITNGTKLDEELNHIIAEHFDIIGFSVDSLNESTNIQIGRQEDNSAININDIIKNILFIKELNSDIKIKINTVVNKLNYDEFIGDFLDKVKPNKWKVFKMLPIIQESKCLEINDTQFKQFLDNHQMYKDILYVEDNDDMTGSYLMIDPLGRFFQNDKDKQGYAYSSKIHEVGIEQAFSEIKFDKDKFSSRYKKRSS